MKKGLTLLLMVIVALTVFVSCDEAKHEHAYSTTWKFNETNHWHECECNEKKDVAAHTFEVVEVDEKLVKKCTVCEYAPDETITGKLVSTVADLQAAVEAEGTETIYLGSDITLDDVLALNKALTIDLNKKTLKFDVKTSVANKGAVELSAATDSAYTIEIKNGKITGKVTGTTTNSITVNSNAILALDGVDMDVTCKRGIQVAPYAQNATVNVKNSNIKVTGTYVISTEASTDSGSQSNNITISIENSTLEATGGDTGEPKDNTALLINVASKVAITGSTIKGERQGVILRGTGENTVTIKKSTIEATGDGTVGESGCNYKDRTTTWANGNEVALAALVIGNAANTATNTGYEKPTTVELDEVTIHLAEGYTGKHIWVVQQAEDYSVKVTGDINPTWTVNSNRNDADYPTAKIGSTTYNTLQAAIDAASDGNTILLLCDTDGTGIGTKDSAGTKRTIVIDFGGHTYTTVKAPLVGSTGTENQAMHWGKSLQSLTMENGTFAVASNIEGLLIGMQNYVDFTAKDMNFDFSKMTVVSYADDRYTGANAKYNGKERPLFNNNDGAMALTNCVVKLPTSSNMGMSADGVSVNLVKTTVDGNVNLQDSTSTLTIDSETTIKKVVSYFDENIVVAKSNSDGTTTYTLEDTPTT